MDKLLELLNLELFKISDQAVTLGQILIVPTVIVVGLLLMGWMARFIQSRLTTRGVNPDVIHLVKRIFYVIAIAVLLITSLDLLNVPLTAFAFVSGAVAAVGF